jgi:hypothetical protein
VIGLAIDATILARWNGVAEALQQAVIGSLARNALNRFRLDDQMAEFMADVAAYWGDNQPDADLVPRVPWAASSTSEAVMPRGTACC